MFRLILLLFVVAYPNFCKADISNLGNEIDKLHSSDSGIREKTINDLVLEANSSQITSSNLLKKELVKLLVEEMKLEEKYEMNKISSGESIAKATQDYISQIGMANFRLYMNHLSMLISMFQDETTLPLLLNCMKKYSGPEMNALNIICWGKKIIPDLILIGEKTGNKNQKEMSFYVLSTWVNVTLSDEKSSEFDIDQIRDKCGLDSQEIQQIRDALVGGLKTDNYQQIDNVNSGLFMIAKNETNLSKQKQLKDFIKLALNNKKDFVRKHAAKYLGDLGDQSDIESLEKLKNDEALDPYTEFKRKQQIYATGKSDLPFRYPVREAAQEAINKIKAREGMK